MLFRLLIIETRGDSVGFSERPSKSRRIMIELATTACENDWCRIHFSQLQALTQLCVRVALGHLHGDIMHLSDARSGPSSKTAKGLQILPLNSVRGTGLRPTHEILNDSEEPYDEVLSWWYDWNFRR
jgi:hypothetical protein